MLERVSWAATVAACGLDRLEGRDEINLCNNGGYLRAECTHSLAVDEEGSEQQVLRRPEGG
jgi:hypothetical protein